jgi:hypothetical protein
MSDSVIVLVELIALNEELVSIFFHFKFFTISNQVEKSFFVLLKLLKSVTHVVHLFDSVNIHGIGGLWEISGQ